MFWSERPLGVAIIIAAHDAKGFNMHMIEASGKCFVSCFVA